VFVTSFIPFKNNAQAYDKFEVELETLNIENAPGNHSYAYGIDSLGRWLVLGGRIDGLHQIQPFAAFLPSHVIKGSADFDLRTDSVH